MRKLFFKLMGLSLLAASVAGGWLWLDYRHFLASPINLAETGYVVEVPPGGNLGRLAAQLAADGVIDSRRYLLWHARLAGDADNIKTGEYALRQGMTPVELLDVLRQGKVIQYSFTVIEGWTFSEMIESLKAHPQIINTVLNQSAADIMAALGLDGIHPEGRFLPDTYFFPASTRDVDFLGRAYRSMTALLESLWEDRDIGLAVKTPYEALIMASIVEKETGLASERNTIAGVFNRRLLKGMRLQTDPTVIYGMGARFDGNIRRRDLRTDTPYNTYRRHGLPPTPIALPSAAAIEATLHPEEGDALYFVSRGDGSHYFSSTLAEHNEAVIKYQLNGRRNNTPSQQN